MRSMTPPRAVSMTMGMRLVSRTRRHTAKPSIPGSIRSRTTMSGGSAASAFRPSSGCATAFTTKPNWPRYSVRSAPRASSSSIRSTRVRGLALAIAPYDPSGARAQGLDGRQPRGLARGKGAEAEAGQKRQQERREGRAHRECDLPFRAERHADSPQARRRGPQEPSAHGQERRLAEELDEHVPRPRAHRHPEADLGRALLHREEHERADAGPAHEHRDGG